MILGIDPGHKQTAYVLFRADEQRVMEHGIIENEDFLNRHIRLLNSICRESAIEMIAGYGMPVGKEVFETCVFIGRIWQLLTIPKEFVYRKDIKLHLCGTTRAKDGNIRQALIDRLGAPGVKKAPGKTYGLKADEWAALAVAVYYADTRSK
jgi:hypothetical protein